MNVVDDHIFVDNLYKVIIGEYKLLIFKNFVKNQAQVVARNQLFNGPAGQVRKNELKELFGSIMIAEGFATEQEFGIASVKSANKN